MDIIDLLQHLLGEALLTFFAASTLWRVYGFIAYWDLFSLSGSGFKMEGGRVQDREFKLTRRDVRLRAYNELLKHRAVMMGGSGSCVCICVCMRIMYIYIYIYIRERATDSYLILCVSLYNIYMPLCCNAICLNVGCSKHPQEP